MLPRSLLFFSFRVFVQLNTLVLLISWYHSLSDQLRSQSQLFPSLMTSCDYGATLAHQHSLLNVKGRTDTKRERAREKTPTVYLLCVWHVCTCVCIRVCVCIRGCPCFSLCMHSCCDCVCIPSSSSLSLALSLFVSPLPFSASRSTVVIALLLSPSPLLFLTLSFSFLPSVSPFLSSTHSLYLSPSSLSLSASFFGSSCLSVFTSLSFSSCLFLSLSKQDLSSSFFFFVLLLILHLPQRPLHYRA